MKRIALAGILLVLAPSAIRAGAPDPRETREKSIASFEELLARYPETEMQAPSLLMLGALYVEREKDRYLAAVAAHDSLAAAGEVAGEEPRADYSEAIGVLRRVVAFGDRFAGYGEALHALGVCYDESGRTAEAESTLVLAAAAAPSREIRASAWLRLGDIRFAASRWGAALEAYEEARAAGVDESAQKLDYRTGWCLLKESRLPEAGARFREAADRAWNEEREGAASEEILRSLALVQVETDPSDVEGFAARFDDPAYRRAALVALGATLLERDRPGPAATACRAALEIDGAAADAPQIHDRLIEALTAADRKEDAGREMEAFLDWYGPGSAWEAAHGEVEGLNESLLRHAWNAALLRYRSGSDEDLRVAADLFQSYAGPLGGTENRARARLFAAEALFRLERYDESASLYDLVDPDRVPEDDREDALRGAVIAHERVEGHETPMALAAIRYAEAYPESDESAKALLLTADRLDEAGKTRAALGLCERVAARGDGPYRDEAEVRAASLAARVGDREAAETWFRKAAASAKDGEARADRLERAAASALLRAAEMEEQELWAAAAGAYRHVADAYPGTDPAKDALLGEASCRIRFAPDETMIVLADRVAADLAGREDARETLRRCAAEAARDDRHGLAAELLDRAFAVLPDPEDAIAAGAAWEEAARPERAAAEYEKAMKEAPEEPTAPKAAMRLGRTRLALGDAPAAAAAYDRAATAYAKGPDARAAYVLAAEAWGAAGEPSRAEERYRAALASAGDDDPADDVAVAKAHLGLARAAAARFDVAVPKWRAGGSSKSALAEANAALESYRAAIALRFEGITDDGAREAAALLERTGRTAFLREWDAGRIAEASVVEPWFDEAAALEAAAGLPPSFFYASLSDTLARRTDDAFAATDLPDDAWNDFDRGTDLLTRRLASIDRAEAASEVAVKLLDREEATTGEASRAAEKRIALILATAERLGDAAEAVRTSPAPDGLSAEETKLYRSLLEEKARGYDERARPWLLALPAAEPAPPRISRGDGAKEAATEGGTP